MVKMNLVGERAAGFELMSLLRGRFENFPLSPALWSLLRRVARALMT